MNVASVSRRKHCIAVALSSSVIAGGCGGDDGASQVNSVVARQYAKLAKATDVEADCSYIEEGSTGEYEYWICNTSSDRPSPHFSNDACNVHVQRLPTGEIKIEITSWDARRQSC